VKLNYRVLHEFETDKIMYTDHFLNQIVKVK